jgi:Late exocytosis, associated with Golgi transport
MNVAELKAPETYYSKNLNNITVFSYVGLMLTIFLSFGFIRSKRKD